VIDEEKEKLRAHKTWYTSPYNKLFGGEHQKQKTYPFYIKKSRCVGEVYGK